MTFGQVAAHPAAVDPTVSKGSTSVDSRPAVAVNKFCGNNGNWLQTMDLLLF